MLGSCCVAFAKVVCFCIQLPLCCTLQALSRQAQVVSYLSLSHRSFCTNSVHEPHNPPEPYVTSFCVGFVGCSLAGLRRHGDTPAHHWRGKWVNGWSFQTPRSTEPPQQLTCEESQGIGLVKQVSRSECSASVPLPLQVQLILESYEQAVRSVLFETLHTCKSNCALLRARFLPPPPPTKALKEPS